MNPRTGLYERYRMNPRTGLYEFDKPESIMRTWAMLSRKIHRNTVGGLGYLHSCRILSDFEYLMLMSKYNLHRRLRIYEHQRGHDDWGEKELIPIKEFLRRGHEIEFSMRMRDVAMGLREAIRVNEIYSMYISTSPEGRDTYVQDNRRTRNL